MRWLAALFVGALLGLALGAARDSAHRAHAPEAEHRSTHAAPT